MKPIDYRKYDGHTRGTLEAKRLAGGASFICKNGHELGSLGRFRIPDGDLFADAHKILERCEELEKENEKLKNSLTYSRRDERARHGV